MGWGARKVAIRTTEPSRRKSGSIQRSVEYVDAATVVRRAWTLLTPTVFVVALLWRLSIFLPQPQIAGSDARLYFRATTAWVDGGDPWLAEDDYGVSFAAPPPVLLLDVPLLPFGEDAVVVFWWVAGIGAMALAVRRYRLPFWWLLFPPFIEGLLPGSPDLALLGLVLLGAGAVSVAAKPYAAPGLLAEGRWRAVAAGVALLGLSFFVLPWGSYLARAPQMVSTLGDQAHTAPLPIVAWVVVLAATVSLGRRGLSVVVPALLPSAQAHYSIFSIDTVRTSRLLAIGFALPGGPPIAVVALAGAKLYQRWVGSRRH